MDDMSQKKQVSDTYYSRKEIEEIVISYIENNPSYVEPDNALEISLDFMEVFPGNNSEDSTYELVGTLEEAFNIEFEVHEPDEFQTIENLIDSIEEKL